MSDTKDDTTINALNKRLSEISTRLYGERLALRVVAPRRLRRMKKNARYMPKEMFDQLVRNVTGDGQLESVPLCHTLSDGTLEVISGNHRVDAAMAAKLPEILVMVIPFELKPGTKRSKQLSHNALSGQDDAQLLAELWREIDTIEEQLYSGLDSRVIGELTPVKFSGFGPEQIRTESITLLFLPEEVEKLESILDALSACAGSKAVYMAPLSHYERLFDQIVKTKKVKVIYNTAVAFMAMVEQLEEKPEKEAEHAGV